MPKRSVSSEELSEILLLRGGAFFDARLEPPSPPIIYLADAQCLRVRVYYFDLSQIQYLEQKKFWWLWKKYKWSAPLYEWWIEIHHVDSYRFVDEDGDFILIEECEYYPNQGFLRLEGGIPTRLIAEVKDWEVYIDPSDECVGEVIWDEEVECSLLYVGGVSEVRLKT